MNPDELLRSLRAMPRPALSPFFAKRVSALAADRKPRRTPPLMVVYWLAMIFAIGTFFGTIAAGAATVAAVAFAALGDQILGVAARLAAPFFGNRPNA